MAAETPAKGALGPPESEVALLARAEALVGRKLGDLAGELSWAVPPDLRRAKGWVGQLVERCLGVPGRTGRGPDLPELGVEVKTIPLRVGGTPRESTFVCGMRLVGEVGRTWEASAARAKLARVLWVPVEAARRQAIGERRVAGAFLWSPTPEEEAELRADWEELMELVRQGDGAWLDARVGSWMQLRPKARDGRARGWAIDREGSWVPAAPRGFYLRTAFTRRLLERYWAAPLAR